jgi:hypothetical protein
MDAARIAHQKVLNYRRNSHPRSGSTSAKADTMTAAMAFRERIRCDAGRMGIDLKTGDEGPARTGVSDQVWAGRLRRLEAHLVKARS